MDTALTQKFPFILDRNLAKANLTQMHLNISSYFTRMRFCKTVHLFNSVHRD